MRWDSQNLCDVCWDMLFRSTNHIPLTLNGMDKSIAWLEFSEAVKGIMHCVKFGGGNKLAEAIGYRMARQIAKPEVDIVVPVPLSSKRLYSRGYNQARCIALGMSDYWSIPIAEVLKRTTQGQSQAKLNRDRRLAQSSGRYICTAWLSGARIALVDDTCTTGTTLTACAEQLYLAGAQHVEGLAVAKGQ